MTEYVVLFRADEERNFWQSVGYENARSARAAISGWLDTDTNQYEEGGVYVAVPARSWQPVTVKVETKTALKFS